MANKRELQRRLAQQGYLVTLDRWPKKITYYKSTGEALPNMPADPWHMERYLARGFTLVRPSPPGPAVSRGIGIPLPQEEAPAAPSAGDLVCTECGFEAKSAFGLQAHKRSHKREIKKGG